MDSIEVGFKAEAREALAMFAEAKALAEQAKKLKEQAEATLRSVLENKTVATVGGVPAFKLVESRTSRADLKQLEKDFPEAFKATLRVTEYDFIKAL